VKGELLTRKIASVEAGANVKVESVISLTISPLAVDDATLIRLRAIKPVKNCSIITSLMDGKEGRYVVVQQVLHGKVNLGMSGKIGVAIDAKAEGELIKAVAKVFSISEGAVRVTGSSISFVVSESPDEMTLAIVPAYYSAEELARITLFMEGLRGAELELAVREAIIREPPGLFEQVVTRIRSLLGDRELRNKEVWADRIVNGEHRLPIDEIAAIDRDRIDFRKVAYYGAAMELVRSEAPQRQQ
jgi:hypothetical protein